MSQVHYPLVVQMHIVIQEMIIDFLLPTKWRFYYRDFQCGIASGHINF